MPVKARCDVLRKTMNSVGQVLGRYLSEPVKNYRPLTTSAPTLLRPTLQPGDVLLVEGNTRVSGAIKYLTQSTWSHAALYIGTVLAEHPDDPDPRRSSRWTWSAAYGRCH